MNIYISTKQEFTSLYRFGYIPIIMGNVIDIGGKSTGEVENSIFDTFLSLAPFAGDEEYLFLCYKGIEKNILHIEEILEVIPLTDAAKSSLQLKFSSKIKFSKPRYQDIVRKVEDHIDIRERFMGAEAFWKLCEVPYPIEPVKDQFESTIKKALHYRKQAKKSETLNDESETLNNRFFFHVLIYERYDFFPNTDLGYFYDVGEVLAHTMKRASLKGSSFYAYLERNKSVLERKSLIDIADNIADSEETKKFTSHLTNNNKIKSYIVAALFFKFKSELYERESVKNAETMVLVRNIRNNQRYIFELYHTIYLTGAFHGYGKFYDDLYEKIDLKIFRTHHDEEEGKSAENARQVTVPTEEATDFTTNKIEITTKVGNQNQMIEQKKVLEKIKSQVLSLKKEEYVEIKTEKLALLIEILQGYIGLGKRPQKGKVLSILKKEFSDWIEIKEKGKKGFAIKEKGNEATMYNKTPLSG
jgi:hypothetical protein